MESWTLLRSGRLNRMVVDGLNGLGKFCIKIIDVELGGAFLLADVIYVFDITMNLSSPVSWYDPPPLPNY